MPEKTPWRPVAVLEEKQTRRKILIVEDEETVSHLVRQFFAASDYAVQASDTKETTMILCAENKPDAAILDMVLTDDSGPEIFHYFQWLNVPVIVTSILNRENVVALLGTKEFLFIAKPFDIEELGRMVESLFS